MEFKQKFIGFIDILGYKNLVEKAEKEYSITLNDLLELAKDSGSWEDVVKYQKYGPTICSGSLYYQYDLDLN